jgi:integrase
MASISKREGKRGTSYKAVVRMKGYPTQSATFDRLTDAKRWAAETETAIHAGQHFKTIEAKKHTLGGLVDRYIKEELPAKPKSGPAYKRQLEWWKDQLGERSLADINRAALTECISSLSSETTYRGTTRSGATVNRYLAALSHCFSKAVEWEWIDTNPLAKISRKKESAGRVRFLSDDERDRLLTACKESRNPDLYLIVLLAISTGARYSEILELEWENVLFEQQRLVLVDTKNGTTRAAYLSGDTLTLMKERSKIRQIETVLVFPAVRKKNQPLLIRDAWERALKRADIQDFRFHDLRHTAASYLAMNGATLAEIAEILGHKTLQMVKRYSHLSDQHVSSVVGRMNEKIFGKAA